LKIKYEPSPGQVLLHSSTARFCVCSAGSRFGKSMAAGAEVAFEFLKPNRRVWIVGTQYELAEKEFAWVVEFLSRFKIDDEQNFLSLCKVTNSQKGAKEISSPWGSFVRTKSTEKPQLLLGDELNLLVLAEASQIPKKIWERMLRARIGPRQGKMKAFSTGNGDNNLFSNFVADGKVGKNDTAYFKFKTIDNPYFPIEEYEQARKELDKKVFAEQYEGEIVSRRGKIFDLASTAKISLSELNSDFVNWPILAGFQRGYKNPAWVVFVTVSPKTHEIFVIDEIVESEKTTVEVAQLILEKMKGRKFLGCVCDQWDTETDELKRCGIPVSYNYDEKKIGKNMACVRRIQGIQNAIKEREDGSHRIYFLDTCAGILEAFEKAKWDDDEKKEEKEALENELPASKYVQAIYALAHVIGFLAISAGLDYYRIK